MKTLKEQALEAFEILRLYQETLHPGDRIDVWNNLMAGFCPDCARKLNQDDRCFCNRDE